MEFKDYFPVWDQLTAEQKKKLSEHIICRTAKKGDVIHSGDSDCLGLLLIRKGQLRAFILSDEGREITIYRLLDMDICLFSASCMMHSIQFEITIEAEKDTDFWIIPADVYKEINTHFERRNDDDHRHGNIALPGKKGTVWSCGSQCMESQYGKGCI